MLLTITIYLKGSPVDVFALLNRIRGRISDDDIKADIKFKDLNIDSTSLGFQAWFIPVNKPETRGAIHVHGAGIDEAGRLLNQTMIEVRYDSNDQRILQPIWKRIYKLIRREKIFIRSYSGGIDPLVLDPHPRPSAYASLDEWFRWFEEEEHIYDRKHPSSLIKENTGHDLPYIYTARSRWKKKKQNK